MKEMIQSTLSKFADVLGQEWFRQGIITEVAGGFICFLIAWLVSQICKCGKRAAFKIRTRRSLVVALPPGHHLVRWADACCAQKTVNLVDQIVADMRKEHFARKNPQLQA